MFKGRNFDRSVILLCVRGYLAYCTGGAKLIAEPRPGGSPVCDLPGGEGA
jgi:hypothetical protein